MKICVFITSLLIALAGCASSQTIQGPDGTPRQLVTCMDITACYQEAIDVCGGTYKIVNSSEGWESRTTHLLIKCNAPVATAAGSF